MSNFRNVISPFSFFQVFHGGAILVLVGEGKVSNVQFQQCNFTFPIFHFSHRGAVLVLVLEGGAFEVQMKSPHSHPTMPANTLHWR